MNIRKPVDYNAMFTALDALMMTGLPQMELYCEIGRLVSVRTEKELLLLRRSTYAAHTLMSPASPLGTCAGCGSFTAPITMPRRYWPKP